MEWRRVASRPNWFAIHLNTRREFIFELKLLELDDQTSSLTKGAIKGVKPFEVAPGLASRISHSHTASEPSPEPTNFHILSTAGNFCICLPGLLYDFCSPPDARFPIPQYRMPNPQSPIPGATWIWWLIRPSGRPTDHMVILFTYATEPWPGTISFSPPWMGYVRPFGIQMMCKFDLYVLCE